MSDAGPARPTLPERPPTPRSGGRTQQPAGRAQIVAVVAGVLALVLVGWLLLRFVGAGSDASSATRSRDLHRAAGSGLQRLDGALAVPEDLALEGGRLSAIQPLSTDAQSRLAAAGHPDRAARIQQTTAAYVTAFAALAEAQDAATGDPPQAPSSPGEDRITELSATTLTAAQGLTGATGELIAAENSDEATADAAIDDADSTRRASLLLLIVVLGLVAAAAVAWYAGLVAPRTARPRSGLGVPSDGASRHAAPHPAPGLSDPDADRDTPDPAADPAERRRRATRAKTRTRDAGAPRAKLAVTTSAHPGTTLDAAEHAGLAVFAGSMAGPEHRAGKNVAPREDAYGWAPGQDAGVIAVAVADGVGSARNSHAASLLATETAVAILRQVSSAQVSAWFEQPELWQEQAYGLMTSVAAYIRPDQVDARARMIDAATGSSNSGQRSLDPATTLVVALGVVSGDGVRVLWASVGDSQVAVLAPGAPQLSWAQEEGDSSSGTRALPRDANRVLCSQYLLPPGHAFLLMTDGCEKVLTVDPGAVTLLHEMLDRPGDTAPLLDLLQRTPRGAGDDRTLIMFAPVGGAW